MTDFLLVFGLLSFVLSLPLLMAGYAHSTRPFGGALLFALGAGLVGAAFVWAPEPYTIGQIPYVALSVLARALP